MVQLPKKCDSTNTSHVEYVIQMLTPHSDLRFGSQFIGSPELVYTRKMKNQQKKQFIQKNETLNDFVIGGNANVFLVVFEVLELQAQSHYD